LIIFVGLNFGELFGPHLLDVIAEYDRVLPDIGEAA
jgi:hypothetical protein